MNENRNPPTAATPAFAEPIHVGGPNVGDKGAFLARVDDILDRKWMTNNGPLVQEFEKRIAKHLGVRHCVAMCNGTIALEIAIRALELKDEVILPSWTFVATAHALSWQGITPVFADIDPVTENLDPGSVRRMITPRTTGIIGVHVWGRAAPVEALKEIADEHGLQLMFDAAHAFGCSHKGTQIGNFGACEVLSFHATKFFNTFEGGAVVTNDDALAEKMRLMRNFGFSGYDNVIHPGTNGKMIEVCAAMGLVNLDNIDNVIAINRRNYEAYRQALQDHAHLSLIRYDEREANNFQYIVVSVGQDSPVGRDAIIDALHANNVLARKYFWPGCHGMKPYRELYPHAHLMLPHTVSISERNIVLPTGTSVDESTVTRIVAIIEGQLPR